MKDSIVQLKKAIEGNSKFLLINHIRMDPDALWSLWGLYLLLEKLGKIVKATNDEAMPENYMFLTPKKLIEPNLDVTAYNPDVIISLDAASEDQLWTTFQKNKEIFSLKEFFVIDHHITNPWFWKYNIIDIQASSSCELVYEIIEQMWYQDLIDKPIATLLLAGIHTDTNTFYNKNTTPKTLQIASKLLEKWAKNKEIIFEFFRKKSFEKAKLWGNILKNIQKTLDGKVVWVTVKKNEFSNLSIGEQGLKWLLNEFLANIEGADIAFLLYEMGNPVEIKASIRSNNDTVDVSKICQSFGWGGHKLAAWFTSEKSLEDVQNELLWIFENI